MVHRNAARFGENERPAAPFEKGQSKALLKVPELGRDRGLRHIQPFGGTRQVPLVRHGVKIPLVVKIQRDRTIQINGTISA